MFPVAAAAPNYRSSLHEFSQKRCIQPLFHYDEHPTSRTPSFKCTITFMLDGKHVRKESRGFFATKDEAKESAACVVMLSMGTQSRGVSWKSRLKEYYDKQGQPGKWLCYETEPDSRGGFVSSIYIPELHGKVKGQSCKSKKEAEQDTARKVLELLGY